MNFTVEGILIVGSFLLFISILSSKISTKLGIPTLLLFLTIGMLAGSDGLGWVHFEDPYKAQVLGAITLTFILFSGGLDTAFEDIRPIIWNGVLLSTLGVLITASTLGYFIYLITDFSLLEGLLVGSIVSSTDATAVFSILRSRNIHLKAKLAPTLELESGSNDPMAYFLTIFFTGLLANKQEISVASVIPKFLQEMLIGGFVGFIMGKAMVFVINKARLPYEALYPALTLSMILFTYSATNVLHGNGFLAVYAAGLVLGSRDFIHKKSLVRFYDGIAWLMQAVMFIVLGLLVFPPKLIPIAGIGLLIAAVSMFVARPLSVFLSLAFSKTNFNQKLFISWIGLKGAVPIVFATYPLIAKIDKCDTIFHIVFFIVFTSVLLQGTTLYPFAKRLKLEDTTPIKKQKPWTLKLSEDVKSVLLELVLPKGAEAAGKQVVQLGLPKNALIVLIERDKRYLTPRGDTVIEGGDKLIVMADDKDEIKALKAALGVG